MFRSANQPVCVGASPSIRSGRHQRKPSPAEASRYFSTPAPRKSTPSSRTSIGYVPDRLVGVEQDERAAGVRELDDLLDREPRAVAVADRGDRDERRPLVDRRVEALERDLRRRRRGHGRPRRPRSSCACQIWPTVGKLEVGHDDARPLARSLKRARQRAHAGRERGRDGDLVGPGADEPGERRSGRLGALDPVVPGRAAVVPARQVVVVGGTHRIRERALRARVDVDEPLEDREPVSAAVRHGRGVNGQGRPSADRRWRSGRRPAPRGRRGPSRARSRGRRSRARRSRSARRRARRRPRRSPA